MCTADRRAIAIAGEPRRDLLHKLPGVGAVELVTAEHVAQRIEDHQLCAVLVDDAPQPIEQRRHKATAVPVERHQCAVSAEPWHRQHVAQIIVSAAVPAIDLLLPVVHLVLVVLAIEQD